MASNMVMCDPCSRLMKSSEGLKYCTDCEDVLCTDCIAIHSAVKILASHYLVDLSVRAGNMFSIKKTCNVHEGMCHEFYCPDHDCLICRTCMANEHRTCGKIQPIDVVAKGCKSSAMLEEMTGEITALLNTTTTLIDDRRKNKTSIGQSRGAVLKEIAKFRQEINVHLDQLERKLLNELDNTERTSDEKANIDLGEANRRQQVILNFSQQVDFFCKHGSESQLFILLHTMKTDISRQAASLQDLIPTLETNDIGFEPTDLISLIKSFGSIKKKSSLCLVKYQLPKNIQVHTRKECQKVPSKFQIERKVEITSGRITCMIVTNDNMLLLCNDGVDENNVSQWTETGQHLKSCTAEGRAFGIAIIPGTDEAVVTFTNMNSIQFISLTNLIPGRRIGIEAPSTFGVAVIKHNVYVGSSKGTVSIINRISGKCLKTLNVGRSHITSIIPFVDDNDERLYCCEYDGGNQVSCIKLDGTRVFSCFVNKPITLALDTKRNSYVTSFSAAELHRISPDGKVDDIILQKSNGLKDPVAVAFNKTYTKIYISNDGNVMIFNCK